MAKKTLTSNVYPTVHRIQYFYLGTVNRDRGPAPATTATLCPVHLAAKQFVAGQLINNNPLHSKLLQAAWQQAAVLQ